jgi:hypothetical protein
MGAEDERLLKDRAPLLAAISRSRPYTHEPTVFHVQPLVRALKQIGFGTLDPADASLKEAVKELVEKIATSKTETESLENQKVAAHILRGSIAAARAEVNSNLRDECRHLAEQEFSSALELRPKDLDALELRGLQRQLRGNEIEAQADFEWLSSLAKASAEASNSTTATKMLIRAARGYRWQAGLFEQRATTSGRRLARRRLNTGLETLNAIGSLSPEAWFEKGCLHTAYARLQIDLNLSVAKTHLNDAIAAFAQVQTDDARKLKCDAEDVLREHAPPRVSPPRWWSRWLRSRFG